MLTIIAYQHFDADVLNSHIEQEQHNFATYCILLVVAYVILQAVILATASLQDTPEKTQKYNNISSGVSILTFIGFIYLVTKMLMLEQQLI